MKNKSMMNETDLLYKKSDIKKQPHKEETINITI